MAKLAAGRRRQVGSRMPPARTLRNSERHRTGLRTNPRREGTGPPLNDSWQLETPRTRRRHRGTKAAVAPAVGLSLPDGDQCGDSDVGLPWTVTFTSVAGSPDMAYEVHGSIQATLSCNFGNGTLNLTFSRTARNLTKEHVAPSEAEGPPTQTDFGRESGVGGGGQEGGPSASLGTKTEIEGFQMRSGRLPFPGALERKPPGPSPTFIGEARAAARYTVTSTRTALLRATGGNTRASRAG